MQDAVAFLRGATLAIEPRKQWPDSGLQQYCVQGNIRMEHRAEPGKALCNWDDAVWGEMVRRGKCQDHHLADELVRACVKLMARWSPTPAPQWVTCIPSQRHPDLVPDFAARLAKQLGLPFQRVLRKAEDRPEQKMMAKARAAITGEPP